MEREQLDAARRLILSSPGGLPALPKVVERLLAVTDGTHATAAQIEAVLAADQAIAARALRLVNSSYYGLARQVESLGHTVVILGTRQVRNIALSAGSFAMFAPTRPELKQPYADLCGHSNDCAYASGLICRQLDLDLRKYESAHMLGLLHDIGHLYLMCHHGLSYMACLEQGPDLEAAIADKFGAPAAEVGSSLLDMWRLPQDLCRNVEILNPHPDDNEITWSVHLAHRVLAGEAVPIIREDALEAMRADILRHQNCVEPGSEFNFAA